MDGSMSGRHEARRCRHEQRNAYASRSERDADADAGAEGPIASELAQGRSRGPWRLSRIPAGALRQDKNQRDDHHAEYERCQWPADVEPAFANRLVEEIAEGGPERAGENERSPEENHVGDVRPEIECRHDRENGAEYNGAALVTRAGICDPIAERRAQRL